MDLAERPDTAVHSTPPPEESVQLTTPPATTGGGARWRRLAGEPRTLAVLAGLLVACWLVPVLAQLARIDWILPVLLLLGTASLLRAGRTVIDRLVLAMALLASATCAAGLVFSVWPWKMHPVPVAGVAFTGLLAVAVALGRRPEVPREFKAADGWLVGIGLACAGLVVSPFARGSLADRIGMVIGGEDFARHYMIYDGIRVAGGYVFLHHHEAPFVNGGYATYPQGSHLIFGLLENFFTSSPVANNPLVSFDHLIWFFVASYAGLCVSVLWALRWIAGRALKGWLALPVFGIAAGYLVFSDPLTMLENGYPSELVGLSLLAVLLAVVARPVRKYREQLVLMGMLFAAISFTYYFLLPVAGAAIVVHLIRYRRRARRHAGVTLPVALFSFALALVSPLVNARANSGSQLQLTGGAATVDRTTVAVLVLLVGGALALRSVRRRPVWQLMSAELLLATGLSLLIMTYQLIAIGKTEYYFEKSLHELAVVALVGLGAVVTAIRPAVAADARRQRRWPKLAGAISCVLLAAAGVTAFAGPIPTPAGPTPLDYSLGVNYLLRRAGATPSGVLDIQPGGNAVVWAARHIPPQNSHFTMVLVSRNPYANFYASLYLGVLQRNYWHTALGRGKGYAWLYPYGNPHINREKVIKYLGRNRVPTRLVVRNRDDIAAYRQYAREHPEKHVVVVDANEYGR